MLTDKGANKQLAWLAGLLTCLLVIFAVYYLSNLTHRAAKVVVATISNVEPRRDVTGQIINAHRGCLQFFNGTFYLYGTAFGTNHDDLAKGLEFVVYSSPDLETWTYAGKLLKAAQAGFYSRAFVGYNPTTLKYVAWYSWYPTNAMGTNWMGQAGVAVSDSPTGPFVVVNPKVHLMGKNPGDGSLFVDDDGTGYYIYTDMDKEYSLRVEQLTRDFLDTDGKISDVMAKGVEAPVLFRRGKVYYILSGPVCGDCPEGSDLQVSTCDSPLGQFLSEPSWNINRRDVADTAGNAFTNQPDTDLGKVSARYWRSINRAVVLPNIPVQQTWVIKLPAAEGANYIWIADRWGSSPDGVSAHDLQYWSPLHFSDDGEILPLKPVLNWKISFSPEE